MLGRRGREHHSRTVLGCGVGLWFGGPALGLGLVGCDWEARYQGWVWTVEKEEW